MSKPEEKYLEPGLYMVEAKFRGTIRVENADTLLECDAVDEMVSGGGSPLVDWEIAKIR